MAQMHSWSGDSRTTSRIPTDQYDAMIRAPGKVVLVAPEYMLPYDARGIHFTSPAGRRLGEYIAKAHTKIVIEKQAWERGCLRDSDATPSLYGNGLENWGVTFDLAAP